MVQIAIVLREFAVCKGFFLKNRVDVPPSPSADAESKIPRVAAGQAAAEGWMTWPWIAGSFGSWAF